MQPKSKEIIAVGEHKAIASGAVICEIEPHTVESDFLMYDVDAHDSEGNHCHRRITFPMPYKESGHFPDEYVLGKILHVEYHGKNQAVFSLN
ncbi:MAG: hypothetical protein KDH97_15790 [Calditrichaeota bacterium]|nr:hypothetical protein [Calditrichota bacterium]MCB0305996.1 hypothetical protein [Calditrichota bacterium]MCB0315492.1 hypothetical protein [Calditrichota bacterium]MCB9088248.1 hypothetical protein [Calditrichia bacterium]